MSIIRIARIFKRSLPPKLGRWRTDEPIDVIYRKVELATDDHCGSDLCQKKVEPKKENPKKSKIVYDMNAEEMIEIGDTDLAFFGGNMPREAAEEMIEIGDTDLAFFGGGQPEMSTVIASAPNGNSSRRGGATSSKRMGDKDMDPLLPYII